MRAILSCILILIINAGIYAQDSTEHNAKDTLIVVNADTAVAKVKNVDSVFEEQAKNIEKQLQEDAKNSSEQWFKVFSFGHIFWALVVLVGGYFSIRFIGSVLERMAEKSTNHRITLKGVIPIIKISGWILILVIIIAGIFQPPVSMVTAITASVGIAVGLAAQDILKNIFGGIMILFDRPFQVGDKIEIGEFYGEVLEIGLRSTRIVTADDSLVTVPNSELMNKSVSNSNSGEADCQVVAEIYLPITIDTEKARQIAIEAAQVSRFIYLNKPIVVLFFNDVKERRSYFKMRLKAYVSDIRNEFAFKSDMTEKVMKAFLEEGLIAPDDLK